MTAANDSAIPSAKGHDDADSEMASVVRDAAAQQTEIELEADQEHVEDDAELRDDAEERRRVSGQEEGLQPRATRRPSSEGPSRMPPTTSPMTGG